MSFNCWLLSFLANNWLIIPTAVLLLFPIFPSEWFNYNPRVYVDYPQNTVSQPLMRFSLLRAFFKLVVWAVIVLFDFIPPILALFKFEQMITVTIFIVIGVDLFFNHQVSQQTVILVGISLIALYLEKLVTSGKKIKFLGWVLEWESREVVPQANLQPIQQNPLNQVPPAIPAQPTQTVLPPQDPS